MYKHERSATKAAGPFTLAIQSLQSVYVVFTIQFLPHKEHTALPLQKSVYKKLAI
jgi:hypothetical protein